MDLKQILDNKPDTNPVENLRDTILTGVVNELLNSKRIRAQDANQISSELELAVDFSLNDLHSACEDLFKAKRQILELQEENESLRQQLSYFAERVNIDKRGTASFPLGYGKYHPQESIKNVKELNK